MSYWNLTDPKLPFKLVLGVQHASQVVAERIRNSRPYPDKLWHYTSVPAAQAIVGSNTLRMTHIGYMNDTTELLHGLHTLGSVLVDEAEKYKDRKLGMLWPHMMLKLQRLPRIGEFPTIYATSFSAISNDLSQWRAYCNGENGFALGFSRDGLIKQFPTEKEFAFLPVVYDHLVQRELIATFVATIVEMYCDSFTQEDIDNPTDTVFEWIDFTLRTFATLAVFFKEESFAPEQEFRVAALRITDHKPEYFARPNLLSPFITHKLSRNVIIRIQSAPGRFNVLNEAAMKGFLKSQEIDGIYVDASFSPLRTI